MLSIDDWIELLWCGCIPGSVTTGIVFILCKSAINARSQLSLDSKLTVHKAIQQLIWTYGIELWGCSKPSNTKILQTFQSKMLRIISSAPWYVSNQTLHSDFDIPYVREVVRINANKHKNRSTEHSNQMIRALLNPSVDRRLKRLWPQDLAQ